MRFADFAGAGVGLGLVLGAVATPTFLDFPLAIVGGFIFGGRLWHLQDTWPRRSLGES